MDGFDWVTYFLETPDDAPLKEIGNGPGITWDRLPKVGNIGVSRWDVVVDANGVFPVFSENRSNTVVGKGREIGFVWSEGSWQADFASTCGGESLSVWFYGNGFPVDWVNGCSGAASRVNGRTTRHSLSSGREVVVHLPDGRVLRTAFG